MPFQETATWQLLAKIVAPIVGAVGTAVWWLIRKWVDARFKSVEDRVSQAESDINDLKNQATETAGDIREINAHMEHVREDGTATRESIRRLHDKVDNLLKVNGS